MGKAQMIRKEIIKQYGNVRRFAVKCNIPYSTLVSALNKENTDRMSYGAVMKMCVSLNLDPCDFSPLSKRRNVGEQILENRIMQCYNSLNKEGREKVLELMDILTQIEKYQG